jgi:hypothetical protein
MELKLLVEKVFHTGLQKKTSNWKEENIHFELQFEEKV